MIQLWISEIGIRDQRSAKDGTEEKISGQKGAKRKGNQLWSGAHFTYKLFPCMHGQGHEKEEEGNGDCFNLSVRIRFSFSPMLFSPAKERLAYIAEMKDKLGESEWFKISSKRSVNPDSRTVFNMHTLFCKRFVSINGQDAYLKAAEFIEVCGSSL